MANTWKYREGVIQPEVDLGGFDVEATDGGIGSVDDHAVGPDYLIVDTGFWIFGKKRLIPAGVINRIDYSGKNVFVNMTKAQIKEAPDLDESEDRNSDNWRIEDYGRYYDPYGF